MATSSAPNPWRRRRSTIGASGSSSRIAATSSRERLRLPAIDAFERPLQVEAAERRRHRPLVPVLGPRGQQDRAERDRHQHVPLPPRRVPAAAEHDRDHRLGQEHERGGDGERERSVGARGRASRYRPRRTRTAPTATGASSRRIGGASSPGAWCSDSILANDAIAHAATSTPSPSRSPRSGRIDGPRSAFALQRGRGREPGGEDQPDRRRDLEPGVRPLQRRRRASRGRGAPGNPRSRGARARPGTAGRRPVGRRPRSSAPRARRSTRRRRAPARSAMGGAPTARRAPGTARRRTSPAIGSTSNAPRSTMRACARRTVAASSSRRTLSQARSAWVALGFAHGTRRARLLARHMDRDVGGRRRNEHDHARAGRRRGRRTVRSGPSRALVGDERLGARSGHGSWRQTWVDSNGSYWHFVGARAEEGTIFATPGPVDEDQMFKRMVFSDVERDAFHWRWESSPDGAAWRTMGDRLPAREGSVTGLTVDSGGDRADADGTGVEPRAAGAPDAAWSEPTSRSRRRSSAWAACSRSTRRLPTSGCGPGSAGFERVAADAGARTALGRAGNADARHDPHRLGARLLAARDGRPGGRPRVVAGRHPPSVPRARDGRPRATGPGAARRRPAPAEGPRRGARGDLDHVERRGWMGQPASRAAVGDVGAPLGGPLRRGGGLAERSAPHGHGGRHSSCSFAATSADSGRRPARTSRTGAASRRRPSRRRSNGCGSGASATSTVESSSTCRARRSRKPTFRHPSDSCPRGTPRSWCTRAGRASCQRISVRCCSTRRRRIRIPSLPGRRAGRRHVEARWRPGRRVAVRAA